MARYTAPDHSVCKKPLPIKAQICLKKRKHSDRVSAKETNQGFTLQLLISLPCGSASQIQEVHMYTFGFDWSNEV